MRAREYLNTIDTLNSEIDEKIIELSALKAMSFGIKAIDYSERVQSTPNFDKIGEMLILIEKLEKEIDELTDKYVSRKRRIVGILKEFNNKNNSKLLFERYIREKSLSEISEEWGKSYNAIKKMHKRALNEFDNTISSMKNK